MKVSITHNKEKEGIELMFSPSLSNKELEAYLLEIGFRKANSKSNTWYVKDRPSYKAYVEALHQAINNNQDPVKVKVTPSYGVDRTHIDHYKFSLVTIKTLDDGDEEKGINYVIFDDIKKTALDIATRFAKATYGDRLKTLSVSPRNFKVDARNAFDEGRIINGIPEVETEITKEQETAIANQTVSEYLSTITGEPITKEQLEDPNVLTDEKHEHKIAVLERLKSGQIIPGIILKDYPDLSQKEQFQFGFDGTDFSSTVAFKEILAAVGMDDKYTKGISVDHGKPGFLWEGKQVKMVTANNPLIHNGYASFIGIKGERQEVLKLVNFIEEKTGSKGELGLDYVSFNDYDFTGKQKQEGLLVNESGVYTEETAGDRYERIEIPFPKSYKFSAEIKIVKNEKDRFVYGLSTTNSGLNGYGGFGFAPKRSHKTYATKGKVIQAALKEIHSEIKNQLQEKTLADPTKKGLQKVLTFLEEFAEKEGVAIPKEKQIKNVEKEIKTEETSRENTDKLTEKKKVVYELTEQLTDLEIDTEGETENILASLRLELDDILKAHTEVTFDTKVLQILEAQSDWVWDIQSEAVRETFIDLILSSADRLEYTYIHFPHTSGFRIVQPWTNVDAKTLKKLQELIDSYPDSLHQHTDPDGNLERLTLISDQDKITFQVLKDGSIGISSYLSKEEGINYGGSTIPGGKLKKAIQYMAKNPTTLKNPSSENKQPQETTPKPPVIKDITRYGTAIPNVLIPHGIDPPFDSGGMRISEKESMQKTAPDLLKITDANLSETSAYNLFKLSQMPHPTDYGFLVSRSAMLREWGKRGEELFKDLGYPLDLDYPYVNVNTGYKSVYPLEHIIGEESDAPKYWAAIEMYRPLGNVAIALDIIYTEIADLKNKQLEYTNPKTGKAKSKKEDKEKYRNLGFDIEYLENSKSLVEEYLKNSKKEKDIPDNTSKDKKEVSPIVTFIDREEADNIRKQFITKGFNVPFTGKEAFMDKVSIMELEMRKEMIKVKLDEKIEKEFTKWISILEKDLKKFEDKKDPKSKQSRKHRQDRIAALKKEATDLRKLVERENEVFLDELFLEMLNRIKMKRYLLEDPIHFREYIFKKLSEERIILNYSKEPISKMTCILIDDYFSQTATPEKESDTTTGYLDKVIAIMHGHYLEGNRLTKKQVEALKAETNTPNLGLLWEAVELSWLLWYKMLYKQPGSFDARLRTLVRFWEEVQPTYAYSDSSKEVYKQYSTPGSIAAIISEYTNMPGAASTLDPSAGNGLLVLGSDPSRTHVNEIDTSRRTSLEVQGFDTITHFNAAEPFPEEITGSFDVMVTNPPFASWSASKIDKERWVRQYFNNQIGLVDHMRLEHFMAGLALHALKDQGRAAIIILGHVYFGADGYIARYKPFFNWLYRHYHVDDVINMNSFKLYNKQGATAKTMLILIRGRKETPSGVAPTRKEAPTLENMVESFTELWDRVKSHMKPNSNTSKEPIIVTITDIIEMLKKELGL